MSRANFADLLKAQRDKEHKQQDEKPKLEIVQPTLPTLPTSDTAPTDPTSATPPTSTTISKPIAPEKDFAKVANSIVREALSSGMFIGKSKQIYDYLYSLTRGAIRPSRTIRITKSKLMHGSDIGSERTLLKNLAHLKSIGLIKITEFEGQHLGNEYEVILPEETKPYLPHPPQPHQARPKVGTVPSVESKVGGVSLATENKGFTEDLKLSFKDNIKNDDEAFAMLNEVFAKACEKISGKLPNENQKGKWKELAELLVMELEVASARTTSVSDVPAFLTEHLRRRLMPVKRETPKSKSNKSSQTGNQQPSEPIETYQAEPLSEQGRESTKQAFAGYIEKGQKEFLMGLQDSYTAEDWQWLMKELKIT